MVYTVDVTGANLVCMIYLTCHRQHFIFIAKTSTTQHSQQTYPATSIGKYSYQIFTSRKICLTTPLVLLHNVDNDKQKEYRMVQKLDRRF